MLEQKLNHLLELSRDRQPKKVTVADVERSQRIVNDLRDLDDAVEQISKEVNKQKKGLRKELAQHRRHFEKLFAVLETPAKEERNRYARYNLKPWMVRWWMVWRDQEWEGKTWDDETMRTSVRCYNKTLWEKKRQQLLTADVLSADEAGSLTVNEIPQELLEMETAE